MFNKHGFIVDTDSYTGNFERELCAYITGHVGFSGVGLPESEIYLRSYNKLPNLVYIPDEDNSYILNPVSIYPTPGMLNNGMGFHFKVGDEELGLLEYQMSVKDYYEKQISIVEGYRGSSWTEGEIEGEIERYNTKISLSMSKTVDTFEKYPAFQSIIIYFDIELEQDLIDFLQKRCYDYCNAHNINIVGFRFT